MVTNLLKKLLYYWDVLFTAIDIWQLKQYYRLKLYIENREYEKAPQSKEDVKNWEELV